MLSSKAVFLVLIVVGFDHSVTRNYESQLEKPPLHLGLELCEENIAWGEGSGGLGTKEKPTFLLANAEHKELMVGYDFCKFLSHQRCETRGASVTATLIEGKDFQCGSVYELQSAGGFNVYYGKVVSAFPRIDVKVSFIYYPMYDTSTSLPLMPDLPTLPNLESCPTNDFEVDWGSGYGPVNTTNAIILRDGSIVISAEPPCTWACGDNTRRCGQQEPPYDCKDGLWVAKTWNGDKDGCLSKYTIVSRPQAYEVRGFAYDSILGVSGPAAPSKEDPPNEPHVGPRPPTSVSAPLAVLATLALIAIA